ncbi:MAG: metal ABC transporter permease, partial [Clostridia bacterium]|nr:metal ABC transporter permease [Clostridia bacterium]
MTEFFQDLSVNPFLINGLVAGVLAGLACGIIGPYVITKRIVFLAGAIAHIAVGGVGIALFLKYRAALYFGGLEPVHGATAIALLAAIIIGVINEKRAEHADTLIGALWAVSMALGILLIKYTPG